MKFPDAFIENQYRFGLFTYLRGGWRYLPDGESDHYEFQVVDYWVER